MQEDTTAPGPDEVIVRFRVRRYAPGTGRQMEALPFAPVAILPPMRLTADGLRVVGRSVGAGDGARLVTYRELKAITTYGPDKFRRAAAAGYIRKYGTDNRPTFDLMEVLGWLANPKRRATRSELTG